MLTITDLKTNVSKRFRTAYSAGLWLEKQKCPKGLIYAPPEDRVGLVASMVGMPYRVDGWHYGMR